MDADCIIAALTISWSYQGVWYKQSCLPITKGGVELWSERLRAWLVL